MSDEIDEINEEIAELEKKKRNLQIEQNREIFVNKAMDALRKTMDANDLSRHGDLEGYGSGFLDNLRRVFNHMSMMDDVETSSLGFELDEEFDELEKLVSLDIVSLKNLQKTIKKNKKNIIEVFLKTFKKR